MTLTDNGKRVKVGELVRATINQRICRMEHLVTFVPLLRFGLLTRMVKLWIVCVIIKLVAGEMSLTEFPCYKPKPFNYRNMLRIVGGIDAHQSETPYMVGLMKHGGVVCGASIISEKVLILAAHCVCNNQNKIIKRTQVKAFVGMNKLSDVKLLNENDVGDTGATEVYISSIVVHPEYICGKKTENDIGKTLGHFKK